MIVVRLLVFSVKGFVLCYSLTSFLFLKFVFAYSQPRHGTKACSLLTLVYCAQDALFAVISSASRFFRLHYGQQAEILAQSALF